MTPWAQICLGFRGSMGPIKWPMDQTSPTWPGPIERVQDHQEPHLPKDEGRSWVDDWNPRVMSSKLTELTEYSPSALPPSVLCCSGILSQLASSGHFDCAQTYYGYKEVVVLEPSCTKCLKKEKDCFQHYNPRSAKCHFFFVGKKPCNFTGLPASNIRRYLWITGSRRTNVGGPILVGGRPIYSSSEVSISRINTEGVVKQIRQIANSPPNADAEGSDELDGE
ncbi:hypothetical protein O181_113016 [Austropuccinia psidii MF-1]|uniref:Uncharacterized protein n=1 Tax=Austropuccinia psidii MF-1 TaxID=1389203 RepID=A0A9Q3K3H4_9BASI|nr:hypothetical protein [Austropuccinia psidii MF-1]